jgi:hypothetical protein
MESSNPPPRARPSIAATDGFPASDDRDNANEEWVMKLLNLLTEWYSSGPMYLEEMVNCSTTFENISHDINPYVVSL